MVRERDVTTTFDWTKSESVIAAVIDAVSEVSGVDPLELTRLSEAVDPDALDSIFTRTGHPPVVSNGSVEFEYEGYTVVVKANGRGYVYEDR